MKFTIDNYRRFLEVAKGIAPIVQVRDAHKVINPVIILRHDVDFDIKVAYEMSLIEKEMGVTSTYYILLTERLYNPLSRENAKLLRVMVDNGFEIGLHFDPTIYGDSPQYKLEIYMHKECEILGGIINHKIESVSLHNPSLSGKFPMFRNIINAYADDMFSVKTFISDSCMEFRGKDLFEFVEKAKDTTIQVVLHPFHWSKGGYKYPELFRQYYVRHTEVTDQDRRINHTYDDLMGDKCLKEIIKGEKYE